MTTLLDIYKGENDALKKELATVKSELRECEQDMGVMTDAIISRNEKIAELEARQRVRTTADEPPTVSDTFTPKHQVLAQDSFFDWSAEHYCDVRDNPHEFHRWTCLPEPPTTQEQSDECKPR